MIQKTKLILLILILLNIVIASVLLLDFRVFTPPKTTVHIEIAELNADEIILQTTVHIQNNNNFDLIVNDFKVNSKTKEGIELGQILIEGGIVKSNHNNTFESLDSFILPNKNISVLENTLTAVVGFRFFGFLQKTLPIDIYIITSLDSIVDQIQQPTIVMQADIVEINEQGLVFTTSVEMYNPTDLSYSIEELQIGFFNQEKKDLGTIVFEPAIIEPKKNITIHSQGLIVFEALNATTIFLHLNGVAGMQIAGLYESIPLFAELSMKVPDIKQLIFDNTTIDFILNADFKLRLKAINCCFGFQLYNPSNISIIAENLVCSVLRLDEETYTLLGENSMQSCTALPENEGCVQTNITIPYIHYLRLIQKRIRPDFIVLRIDGDLSIAGTRQSVPISLNAYISPYLFFTP